MNLPDSEAIVTAIGDHLISTDFFSTASNNKESTTTHPPALILQLKQRRLLRVLGF